MVALVHDHLPVVLDQRIHLALAGQGLHHGDIDLSSGFGLAAADGADHTLAGAKKRLQSLLPLLQQLRAVNQHQGVDATARNDRRGCDRLAECCRRAEHAGIVLEHRRDGSLLVDT